MERYSAVQGKYFFCREPSTHTHTHTQPIQNCNSNSRAADISGFCSIGTHVHIFKQIHTAEVIIKNSTPLKTKEGDHA